MVTCSHCQKRFHPLCAAKKKYYVSRSGKFEWKFYCASHPPADAVFDESRQSWITLSILSQLQDLRRSLERGRMLQEMARQRDRQHKRLLNMCEWRTLEASVEIVLKKRPTPLMKEIYHSITGDVLIDTARKHKPAPAVVASPVKRPSSKQARSRQLTLMQSMHGKSAVSEDQNDAEDSEPVAGKRRAVATSTNSRAKRQRVGSIAESPVSTPAEVPARRASRSRKPSVVESDASEEEEGDPDMKTVFLSWLEDSTEATDDFDDVVANAYPQVVRSTRSCPDAWR